MTAALPDAPHDRLRDASYCIAVTGEGAYAEVVHGGWCEMLKGFARTIWVDGDYSDHLEEWAEWMEMFADRDEWLHDEANEPSSISADLGETAHVSIYRLGGEQQSQYCGDIPAPVAALPLTREQLAECARRGRAKWGDAVGGFEEDYIAEEVLAALAERPSAAESNALDAASLTAEDVAYPRDVFAALLSGNSPYAFYLFQWVPYQTDAQRWRLKMQHDVKAFDGREAFGIWPNGSSCGPFRDEEVEFIRISRIQWGVEWKDPRPSKGTPA